MTFVPQAPDEQKVNRPTRNERQARESKRTLGEDAAPAPGHSTKNLPADFRTINGWGADLDPANRPVWPKELPSTQTSLRGNVQHWQKPPANYRVHMSNEYPGLTPVFGTSCPPHGLSGLIKDYAYQYGEATNRHWMLLMLSNRIDVLEHMIGDALRGHPDNYVAEKAWAADLKYPPSDAPNKAAPAMKYMMVAGITLGAIAVGVALARRK